MGWAWSLLVGFGIAAVGITLYGYWKSKKLEGGALSLFQLRNEMLFSSVVAVAIVWILLDTTDVQRVYSDNPTIDDLARSVNDLSDALLSLRLAMIAGLTLVFGNALKAIFAFAESITPEDDRDRPVPFDDMIKLDLDDDK